MKPTLHQSRHSNLSPFSGVADVRRKLLLGMLSEFYRILNKSKKDFPRKLSQKAIRSRRSQQLFALKREIWRAWDLLPETRYPVLGGPGSPWGFARDCGLVA